MSPDDERIIEQYVRRPDTLGAEVRRDVQRMIQQDPGAAAYAKFLRGFYDQLDEEDTRAVDARVDAFVDDLFDGIEEAVIPLRPFRAHREARPTVLAAETDASTEEGRFSVLTTLAAEAEQMVVRVVADRDVGRGRLYVLADPPERRAHVVVSFPDLGLDLVAGEEGRLDFELPSGIDAEEWAEAQAVLRRPVASGEVAPAEATTLSLPTGGTLRCRWKEGTLTATVEEKEEPVPTLLTATGPGPSPRLLRLRPTTPVQCEMKVDSPLVLRVYE